MSKKLGWKARYARSLGMSSRQKGHAYSTSQAFAGDLQGNLDALRRALRATRLDLREISFYLVFQSLHGGASPHGDTRHEPADRLKVRVRICYTHPASEQNTVRIDMRCKIVKLAGKWYWPSARNATRSLEAVIVRLVEEVERTPEDAVTGRLGTYVRFVASYPTSTPPSVAIDETASLVRYMVHNRAAAFLHLAPTETRQ